MDFNNPNKQWLVRHGHSEANAKGIIVSHPQNGIPSYGLTEKGLVQARKTAKVLKTRVISPIIICSDFARAHETATCIQEELHCDLILSEDLRERFFGDLEFKGNEHYLKIWEEDRNSYNQKLEGVESQFEILERIKNCWSKWQSLSTKHDLIWVSHGDTLRVMLCFFLNLSLKFCHDLPYLENAQWIDIKPRKKPLIAAHRGNSASFTENTISAFESAINLKSDYIELDFHYTKDQIPLCNHDEDLVRIFNINERVGNLTFNQITHLVNKADCPPTLEKVLKLAESNSTKALCEMKAGYSTQSQLGALLSKHQEIVELMDFDYQNLLSVKHSIPEIPLIWLIDQTDDWQQCLYQCLENGFFCINPNKELLLKNPSWIPEAHKMGLKVYTWTVDDLTDAINLIIRGIDLITTNNPAMLVD